MDLEHAHTRATHRPSDPHSSPPSPQKQNHKRQRSQTLGTTFVSTAVVPARSSTDVLSSLISSLTLLSDSAREQIRSARESDPAFPDARAESNNSTVPPSDNSERDPTISVERCDSILDVSDGEEAEPPVAGYVKSRSRDQRRPSVKEKWKSSATGKEKASNPGRSESRHTILRPQSGASSGIGIPSIERVPGASSSSLAISLAASAKNPVKMAVSNRQDDEYSHSILSSTRDTEAKSVRSFRTTRSKQSIHISQDHQREAPMPDNQISTDGQHEEETNTPQAAENLLSEYKTYSPLSPANREDLSEHLIPSRRSSMRHSPKLRGTSKGRSPSSRTTSLYTKSIAAVSPEIPTSPISEQAAEEEDSTLRRIRELQQAKEQRHLEWRKESRRSERNGRKTSRSRAKVEDEDQVRDIDKVKPEVIGVLRHVPPIQTQMVDRLDVESVSNPHGQEIHIPSPSPNYIAATPSPALSMQHRHKRSLSAGLRRSNSSRHRPVDELRNVQEQVEAFLTAPRLTQRIRHPRTGRTVAFSEVGDPNGFAVFCCVGMGLTRYVTSFYDDVARTQKLRLITPDRPGIGETSPFSENVCTPLAWVDDVAVICQVLNIEKFSLLAHSAGSIYALATALKMPDRVRGSIHLLAPWIPPSQFPSGGLSGEHKAVNLPIAHKLLSVLPAPFLKAANSRFLSATSASIEPRVGKGRRKDLSISATYDTLLAEMAADLRSNNLPSPETISHRNSSLSFYSNTPMSTPPPYSYHNSATSTPVSLSPNTLRRQMSGSAGKVRSLTPSEGLMGLTPQARQALFNSELTHRTWALATLNANPSVDLLVCLERRRPIGFKYTDVTRAVVIHHGRNDNRVPLDNVQWLSKVMKRCELRILNDEGHGLMASASVMSRVLAEIGRECEECDAIARENEKIRKDQEAELEKIKEVERRRFIRGGY